MSFLELWGGVECTVNRVGNTYLDQNERSGHLRRLDDLRRFAELGIKKLRVPALWERVEREPGRYDFAELDRYLNAVRGNGIEPIVTFVHHGSGPPWTSLLEESFVAGLSGFAGAFARRYPWVRLFTPINEPLTTARFSGLYGHWYPHARENHSFVRALLTEVRAIASAMAAVRETLPEAQLVQTEDIGTAHGTPRLAYQTSFENERRWLSFDLLCGTLDPTGPIWQWLLKNGAPSHTLQDLCRTPTPPDVLGVNYYVTSERWIDERLDRFPASSHGGNGLDAYADVEAVRVREAEPAGWTGTISAAWKRFGLPIALTEVHLGCTREEQMRWLHEAWKAAKEAHDCGIDVRAVTLWALLGSHDWCSLVTRDEGRYEPGVFDLRAVPPRATALAHMAKELARTGSSSHAVLDTPGWWHRSERFFDAAEVADEEIRGAAVLVIGGGTTLATMCRRAIAARGMRSISIAAPSPAQDASIACAIDIHRPWAVVDAGVLSSALGWRLAAACKRRGLAFLAFNEHPSPFIHPHTLQLSISRSCEAESDVRSAIDAGLDLLIDGEQGVWSAGAMGVKPYAMSELSVEPSPALSAV